MNGEHSSAAMNGRVVSVNVSRVKGAAKEPVSEIEINNLGVVGDAHAGAWSRQVSILSIEAVRRFAEQTNHPVGPGSFAENITTDGIDIERIGILDFIVAGEARIQVAQVGKKCHGDACAIYKSVGRCVMPAIGLFCRVVSPGRVKPGDKVQCIPRPLRFRVITASDRASMGIYQDKAGPAVMEALRDHFRGRRWHPEFSSSVVPDEPALLRAQLDDFLRQDGDVVFLTGGTGIGPRDFTPEVVAGFCDRLIPGIMEHARMKAAGAIPTAALSRSVAGARGTMLVFALPGSPGAVADYMACILPILEHAILMLHGIDAH